MSNANHTGKTIASVQAITQNLQATFRFNSAQAILIMYTDTGRIVSTVFQFFQSIQQNSRSLAMSCISNNAAHKIYLQI
jgi:hypothetical protein